MGEHDLEVIRLGVTDEGRVSITTAADPPVTVTASPRAARELSKELVEKAKIAEQRASISFQVVRIAPAHDVSLAAIQNPSSKQREPRSGKGSRLQAMSLLVRSGHLHIGERLRAVYPASAPDAQPAWLTVTSDARLKSEGGDTYNNPSKAVKALFQSAPATINGWGVLKAHRDGLPLSLSEIKKDEAGGGAPRQRTEWPTNEDSVDDPVAGDPPPSIGTS